MMIGLLVVSLLIGVAIGVAAGVRMRSSGCTECTGRAVAVSLDALRTDIAALPQLIEPLAARRAGTITGERTGEDLDHPY